MHGKGIQLSLIDLNNKVIYSMLQEAKTLKETTRNTLHLDLLGAPIKYRLLLKNETLKRLKINISGLWVLAAAPYQ